MPEKKKRAGKTAFALAGRSSLDTRLTEHSVCFSRPAEPCLWHVCLCLDEEQLDVFYWPGQLPKHETQKKSRFHELCSPHTGLYLVSAQNLRFCHFMQVTEILRHHLHKKKFHVFESALSGCVTQAETQPLQKEPLLKFKYNLSDLSSLQNSGYNISWDCSLF